MAERFERLYELPGNLYSVGSPAIVSAGALLKDKQTGSMIVQLKFQSVSSALIKALKVGIIAYDVAGKEVAGVEEYQYLDLRISNGQTFGSNKAIVMPNAVTRSFSISSITVVLADGTVKDVSMPMIALPKAMPLQSGLKDTELVKQYKLTVNDEAAYIPQERDGLWMCSCGEWDSGDSCTKCRAKKTAVFSAFDIPTLTDEMTSRLATERAQREEQQRLAEIERQRKAEQDRIAVEEAAKRKAIETEKRKRNAKKAKIAAAIIAPIIALVFIFSLWVYPNMIQPSIAYKDAEQLLLAGQYQEAKIAFESLGEYKDSPAKAMEAEEKVNAMLYYEAEKLLESGESIRAAIEFGKIADFSDARERSNALWGNFVVRQIIAGFNHIVGLKSDGTVLALGLDDYGECNVSDWTDIISVAAGTCHTVGLKTDGTVVAVGDNRDGQCDVTGWADIVSVYAEDFCTIGLKMDGTVLIAGTTNHDYDVSGWEDIISISLGEDYLVGLKVDGTVVATGSNIYGQCDVVGWSNIISISAGSGLTVGLKADGTVVVAGHDFDVSDWVSNWENIAAVYSCTVDYTKCVAVGLESDGTAMISGSDYYFIHPQNIVSVASSSIHFVCLREDGVVLAFGNNDNGQCNVSEWTDIVSVFTNPFHTLGVKSDGTVVETYGNQSGAYGVSNWTDIRIPE